MFGTIRRHQKWLVPATFITVVCFVAFFSPTSKSGCRATNQGNNYGSIGDEPISEQDFRQAQADVYLYYFLNHSQWPDTDPSAKQMGFDLEREIYFRLFFIKKIKENNIHVGDQAIGEMAASILRGLSRNTPVTLEMFEKQVLAQKGFNTADFRRFLEHQLGLQQLASILGMSGRLITTDEASSLLRLENQQITTEAVFFSVSNQLAAVVVTPDELGRFYTNQMARYRLPERVQVSYVKFNLSNYLAQADAHIATLTNFDLEVDAIYTQRGGTNYYTEVKSPAEAKAKIREERRNDLARYFARTNAMPFADELISRSAAKASDFADFAAKRGLSVATSAPFDIQNGPEDLKVPATFTKAAFKLTAEDPFAGPIPAEDSVYVIALKAKFPSEIPPLTEIQAKVQADCQFMKAAQLTYNSGTNLASAFTAGLAQGKTFSTICAESKLQPVKLPPFSLSTRSLPEVEKHISLGRLQEIAFALPIGNTSGYVPTEDGGGVILHVISRTPGDESKITTEFPAFLAQVRQTRQNEAFNRWFGREAERALRNTPLNRPKQP